ncbi:hypothetical protein ACGFI9_31920 [Micromonospora sp. NPDC048930]|uniref:hypothetical protein n=1 Tax=Micromonospora sp. NPDC048930 TaxID=3364261 RepID=UPI003712356A
MSPARGAAAARGAVESRALAQLVRVNAAAASMAARRLEAATGDRYWRPGVLTPETLADLADAHRRLGELLALANGGGPT